MKESILDIKLLKKPSFYPHVRYNLWQQVGPYNVQCFHKNYTWFYKSICSLLPLYLVGDQWEIMSYWVLGQLIQKSWLYTTENVLQLYDKGRLNMGGNGSAKSFEIWRKYVIGKCLRGENEYLNVSWSEIAKEGWALLVGSENLAKNEVLIWF